MKMNTINSEIPFATLSTLPNVTTVDMRSFELCLPDQMVIFTYVLEGLFDCLVMRHGWQVILSKLVLIPT